MGAATAVQDKAYEQLPSENTLSQLLQQVRHVKIALCIAFIQSKLHTQLSVFSGSSFFFLVQAKQYACSPSVA